MPFLNDEFEITVVLDDRNVELRISVRPTVSRPGKQCSRIRILWGFFSDFKKHDFLRFLEMTYQKVVKSL